MRASVRTASRLVTFGNAFLSGHDGGRGTNAEIDALGPTGARVLRWRFETLLERRGGILPLRRVATNPYAWFRWLRANAYDKLVLMRLSGADVAALDGPLKVFGATSGGWFVGAERAGPPMLWEQWKSGPDGMFATGPETVEYRGSEVYALPPPPSLDPEAVAAQLDVLLATAGALEPGDAAVLERARAALHGAVPESLAAPKGWPPVLRTLPVRRLIAAVELIEKADDAHSNWDPRPQRPAGFGDTVADAILATVNAA